MKFLFLTVCLFSFVCNAVENNPFDDQRVKAEADTFFKSNVYNQIHQELKKIRPDYYADYLLIRTSGHCSTLQNNIDSFFTKTYEREGEGLQIVKTQSLINSDTYKKNWFGVFAVSWEKQIDTKNGFLYKKTEENWQKYNQNTHI